jgi:TPP-dependent pyruvate/acetoin dehydrogenase alpha subunit
MSLSLTDFFYRYWDQKGHPINRFAGYLVKKGLWDEAKEKEWKETSRKEVNRQNNTLLVLVKSVPASIRK